ncbi:retinitis pigmentosa 9 protein homolog [Carlito syrichta]|uniref:Retinitis pigmentosa 9 protein homolog n=1 Tax=Carlito syrichta TaxID=1868482 RepID=A0A3Q0DSQ5_CARSF|nr:retinitis pigmentosa 9 protein homolog [Carlito syrichta]
MCALVSWAVPALHIFTLKRKTGRKSRTIEMMELPNRFQRLLALRLRGWVSPPRGGAERSRALLGVWGLNPQVRLGSYEKPPPGLIKEDETKPEDCIPDVPGNEHAREFLAHAPTKGLWMPLGKEVKVMQCWRCKRYGHRTGDKECPFFIKGNQKLEQFRVAHEDPMYDIIRDNKRHEKDRGIQQLKQLLEDSTSDEDGSSSSSSDCKEKHKKRKKKEKHKKRKKEKRKKKKRKHKSSKSNESSDSE